MLNPIAWKPSPRCRTAMVAGDEQRTLSVAGHHCPGSRRLPALYAGSEILKPFGAYNA